MKRYGFTLVELLIVVALVGIIALAMIVLFNPWQQINKAYDARRKHDLDVLQKSFEDYYNDKGCYPQTEHVCFDQPKFVCETSKKVSSRLCHICGNEPAPPKFSEFLRYMSKLPCDPQHPKKDYLYQVDRPGCSRFNGAGACVEKCCSPDYCPQWFRIYSDLSVTNDSDSVALECANGGCGPTQPPAPTGPFGYDYGVTSHQVNLEKSSNWQCLTNLKVCNGCGTSYNQCLVNQNDCNKQKIYPSSQSCCKENPGGC